MHVHDGECSLRSVTQVADELRWVLENAKQHPNVQLESGVFAVLPLEVAAYVRSCEETVLGVHRLADSLDKAAK